jgi:hypothetical protein
LPYFCIRLFPSFSGPQTRHPAISFLVFLCVLLHTAFHTTSTYSLLPYILESNPHPFYSFRGLKNQMWIRFVCGLDLRSRARFWKSPSHAIYTIQSFIILFITVGAQGGRSPMPL